MRSALLVVLAAFACGFWVPPADYDQQRAEEIKWLFKQAGDEAGLTRFLTGVLEKRKEIDGVQLSTAKLAAKWQYYGTHLQWLLVSGDWLIEHHDREKEFKFWWRYQEGKAIIVTVRIEKEGVLSLVSVENEKDLITLSA